MTPRRALAALGLGAALAALGGCEWTKEGPAKPRLVMLVGVDVSGSFIKGGAYEDSLDFLAHYLVAHLKGLGGLDVPSALFVGPIGGVKAAEAKTFHPIQTFQDRSLQEVRDVLVGMFPAAEREPYTDFNAFFGQVAEIVRSRRLALKPISVVLLSDGVLDATGPKGRQSYGDIDLAPLERLSRNVTVRLLYTSAGTGAKWRSQVRRRRVKLWTQDAPVMAEWKAPNIFQAGAPLEPQEKFFAWIKDNVDFGVRGQALP